MHGLLETLDSLNGKLFGLHAAVVKAIDDPNRLGRIRVECHSAYGGSLSPWVQPCFPFGLGVGTGSISIPPLDSYVWITFEEGDITSPIYVGGYALSANLGKDSDGSIVEESDSHQQNTSPLPVHTQGLPDGSDLEGCVRNYRNIPPSDFQGEYGRVNTTRTQSGHIIELDDTEGAERIFIHHGPSGSYYEIRRDGSITEVTQSTKAIYTGPITATHTGRSDTVYDEQVTESFGGDYSALFVSKYTVNFDLTDQVKAEVQSGALTATLNDVALDSKGGISASALSIIDLNAGDNVTITSGGDRTDLSIATHKVISLNGYDPSGLGMGIDMLSQGGAFTIKSADPTGLTSVGVEAVQSTSDVVLGNLTLPSASRRSVTAVPLLKEGVVMGTQLQIALSGLIGIFESYAGMLSGGGSTPGYGAPNPVLASANVALATSLASWAATYATPQAPRAQPIYASDTVFVSK